MQFSPAPQMGHPPKTFPYQCLQKNGLLRKFDAKASFEVWMSVSDVVFREESEFEVKIGPKPLKSQNFPNSEIFKHIFFIKFVIFRKG